MQKKFPDAEMERSHFDTDPIPYMYKMTVTLLPGLNHIAWCKDSTDITVAQAHNVRPDRSRLMLPKYGFGTMTTYRLEDDAGVSYYDNDNDAPSPAYQKMEWDLQLDSQMRPVVYTMYPNKPPQNITVLSSPGKVPALWVWAKIAMGGLGFQEVKKMAWQMAIPAYLHHEHIKLIRHVKSTNFRTKLRTYTGELDKFHGRVVPEGSSQWTSYSHVDRAPIPPPTCGYKSGESLKMDVDTTDESSVHSSDHPYYGTRHFAVDYDTPDSWEEPNEEQD